MDLSARDDQKGNPVDWWFMYKVSGKSTSTSGMTVKGDEYLYFDAGAPANATLVMSPHRVTNGGALPATLNQLYAANGVTGAHLGWFFYNDEDPITGITNSVRGHTKGVLAFDIQSDTGFWLIQSTPKFPPRGSYSFPSTGMPNAQTLLCITLQSAAVAQSIAKQMFVAQQPNVYLASKIPPDLAGDPNDARGKLMQNQVASGTTPVQVVIPFHSKGGVKFMSIAKNSTWGLDFYNDLVGPTLHENLDVETWEHDPTPPPLQSDKVHTVVDMKGIDLSSLGIHLAWPEADDHAKLCISARSEQVHFICIGDMNFTIAQRKRGGGTTAFQCEPLWESISGILRDVAPFPHVRAGRTGKAAGVSRASTPRGSRGTAKKFRGVTKKSRVTAQKPRGVTKKTRGAAKKPRKPATGRRKPRR